LFLKLFHFFTSNQIGNHTNAKNLNRY